MTAEVLKFISDQLTAAGINYEFGEWNSDIIYPYFVGEYQETPPSSEDGLQETTFILNGFSRTTWEELEAAKTTIENLFTYKTSILSNGSGVDVSYSGSLVIPTGDAELKRIQINLTIKEWRVINNG